MYIKGKCQKFGLIIERNRLKQVDTDKVGMEKTKFCCKQVGEICTHLIFRIEKLQLIIDEGVLGRFLLPQRSLLLQLRTPECLDGMHTGA